MGRKYLLSTFANKKRILKLNLPRNRYSMNTTFYYKNVNEVIKPDVEAYVLGKIEDLSKFIDAPEGSVLVTFTMEHFEKHDAYQVNVKIVVRSGKEYLLEAEETKHTYMESIDSVRDKLQMQLVKMKDKKMNA